MDFWESLLNTAKTALKVEASRPAGTEITLFPAAARTEGVNGTPADVSRYRRLVLLLDVTLSATDAGDTLDVFVDVLGPDGVTWLNAVHFTQQAGDGAARKEFAVLDASNPGVAAINVTADAAAGAVRPALFGSQIRGRCAIVDWGTANSSHTFSLKAYAQ